MTFIDTHTHNNDKAFDGEQDAIIAKCIGAGVTKMIQADIDSSERPGMYSLVERHPGTLYPMLGLYPGSVDKRWREEMDALLSFRGRGAVAIGEIGLDYHWSQDFREEQKEAFRCQLELAAKMNLPVNIHLRDAAEDFFDIMEDCRSLGIRGNLHAFSGSFETFLRLQKYGQWSVGIGGVLTFKNAAVQESVRRIPLESILLETDSPYLAPTPFRGSRNDSSNIPVIAAKLAELKGVSVEQVAEVTTENAKKLFDL
ncbi:MAG: TatD family hydrolase [Bacteroidales bacterium]|nr:TatD family hydrolase [Bacteroidales bacterium]